MQRTQGPEERLRKLAECLIISFRYAPIDDKFTLISDYPMRSPGSDRELIGIVFNEVAEFARQKGDLPTLHKFETYYESKEEAGARVIQAIRTVKQGTGRSHIELWFGPNFGGITFTFKSFESYTRASRVVRQQGEFLYFDADTDAPFDFFAPFPELL